MITITLPTWLVYFFIFTTVISTCSHYIEAVKLKVQIAEKSKTINKKSLKLLDHILINLSIKYKDRTYGDILEEAPELKNEINKIRQEDKEE